MCENSRKIGFNHCGFCSIFDPHYSSVSDISISHKYYSSGWRDGSKVQSDFGFIICTSAQPSRESLAARIYSAKKSAFRIVSQVLVAYRNLQDKKTTGVKYQLKKNTLNCELNREVQSIIHHLPFPLRRHSRPVTRSEGRATLGSH